VKHGRKKRGGPRRNLTRDELLAWRAEVRDRFFTDGWTARKLAAWYGVTPATIYTALKPHPAPPNP
jgi:predicted transcriptional regulator